MKRVFQLLLILLCHQSIAQESRQLQIDSLLSAVHTKGLFNGVALVVDKGKIILHKAYGLADIENNKHLSIEDKFYIGSLTKQFTAVLILKLNEEELLDINEPISKYLGEFTDSVWANITIHQLLTHTSGFGSYTFNSNFDKSIDYTVSEMYELIKEPLLFSPGTDWSYSNSGYYLLGKIAEKVANKSYGELLKEKVCKPLGLENTGYSTNWIKESMAQGYVQDIDGIQPMPKYSLLSLYSTGGMYSTANDLLTWKQSLDDGKLLSKESLEVLYRPVKNDYACGFYVKKGIDEDDNYFERHFHGGIIQGYHSFMLNRVPQKQFVILLDNYHSKEIQTIKNRIWSALVDEKIREITPKLSTLLFEACTTGSLKDTIDSIYENTTYYESKYLFEEYDINTVGYRLMEAERYTEASVIFKYNISRYPNSWNVYDSMGELQLLQGNYKEAKTLYEKSLTINPANSSAKMAIEKIQLHTTKPKTN